LVQPTDGYKWIKAIPKTNGRTIFEESDPQDQRAYHLWSFGPTWPRRQRDNNDFAGESGDRQPKYTNQFVLSWEVFSTQLKKKAYDQLGDNGITIPTADTRSFTEYLSRVADYVAAEFPTQQVQAQRYRPNVAVVNTGDETVHTEILGGRWGWYNRQNKERHAFTFSIRQEIMDAKRSRDGRNNRGHGREGRGGGGRSVSTVMTEEGMEEVVAVAAVTLCQPDYDRGGNRQLDRDHANRNWWIFHGRSQQQAVSNDLSKGNQAGQTQISLLSARGRESTTRTVGYFDKDSHVDMTMLERIVSCCPQLDFHATRRHSMCSMKHVRLRNR
jgi:hypothetical protein